MNICVSSFGGYADRHFILIFFQCRKMGQQNKIFVIPVGREECENAHVAVRRERVVIFLMFRILSVSKDFCECKPHVIYYLVLKPANAKSSRFQSAFANRQKMAMINADKR